MRWALSKRLAGVESDLSAALQQVDSLTADNSRMDAELQDARKMMAQQKAHSDYVDCGLGGPGNVIPKA